MREPLSRPSPDRSSRILLSSLLLTLGMVASACGDDEEDCALGSKMARTELFFGLDRENAPRITDAEWKDFVDTTITPLFQDGLTMFDADGQYLMSSGVLVREPSKVVVLLHDGSSRRSTDIDTIRNAYIQRFDQESVLRIDSTSCVAF